MSVCLFAQRLFCTSYVTELYWQAILSFLYKKTDSAVYIDSGYQALKSLHLKVSKYVGIGGIIYIKPWHIVTLGPS